MGVADSTLRLWMGKFQTISAAIKKGQQPIDIEVENALLKKALGFTYEEIQEDTETLTNGKKRTLVRKITKTVPPDTVAAIFWLKNRKPVQWRDKPEPPISNEALQKLDEVLNSIKGVI